MIPEKPDHYTSYEAEMDIAYHYLSNGDIEAAMPYLTRANDMICYPENLKRLGTLEVAKEKYEKKGA